MNVRTIPLTLRWHLMAWRGGSRLAAGPVRTHEDGRPRTIGATLSIFRLTVGLARLGLGDALTTGENWYRDFGRFSIGGWSTSGRSVPVSTGWMLDGGDKRIGVSLTLASRSVYLVRLFGLAEYQEYQRKRALHGDLFWPHTGRGRKKRRG
ncbi:hypothetical protein OHS33_39060 (plasmid) [Streptomyces sp. NBC_00536]|uniref:hypothetical protein n=1 Tax=Streptomyces sp. NBC_00536 TaxID=2975769 RepID=UPI002E7FD435|nr:hypothetical protein [Streptomyces sp. NBC_00536]WUC84359.1 hypothetical protein OHS33_39060 [Streptomyces sp. NBC_00536]